MNSINEKIVFVSHELRSPVTSMLDILQNISCVEDITMIKNGIDKLMMISNHMLDNINQVLDLSKTINDADDKEFVLFDLFNEVKNLCYPLAHNKRQKFILDLSKCKNKLVYGNFIKIKSICNNLLTNSVKYTDCEGTISLSAEERKDGIVIKVKDNGIGMDLPILENIFQKKYICQDSTKGTGLGLYITKNICDSIDAKISCVSELGKGTEFTIDIPLNIISEYSFKLIEGKKIVIVDDDPCIASIYKSFFEKMGLVAYLCNTQKEIEEIYQNNIIDLSVLDYRIENLNLKNCSFGEELATIIKRESQSKIMMISSNRQEEVFPNGLPPYIDDFMSKPINYLVAQQKVFTMLIKQNQTNEKD